MDQFESYFEILTDEQLETAFQEYEKWREDYKTLSQEGVFHEVYVRFLTQNNIRVPKQLSSAGMYLMCEPFLFTYIQRFKPIFNRRA